MPGRWKAWKTKSRFSTLPTVPWKSRQKQARFPHFHSSGDEADGKVENQKQVFHFPTAFFFSLKEEKQEPGGLRAPPGLRRKQTRLYQNERSKFHPSTGVHVVHFQVHRPLETKPHFRLILCWKQTQISGSSLDWKMLG
jgi:hypothetical protein